jgi:outer membrane protein
MNGLVMLDLTFCLFFQSMNSQLIASILARYRYHISSSRLWKLSVAYCLVVFATSCQDQKPAVAYVNTDQLLDTYQAMLDARQQYQRQKQEWEHNLTSLEQEARLAVDTARRLGSTMPVAFRAQQATRARLRQQQYLNYRQAVTQQDGQEMERLTRPVLNQVNRYLTRYGRENNYDYILATSQEGNLLYARPTLDITKQVAAGLNQALKDSLQRKP